MLELSERRKEEGAGAVVVVIGGRADSTGRGRGEASVAWAARPMPAKKVPTTAILLRTVVVSAVALDDGSDGKAVVVVEDGDPQKVNASVEDRRSSNRKEIGSLMLSSSLLLPTVQGEKSVGWRFTTLVTNSGM